MMQVSEGALKRLPCVMLKYKHNPYHLLLVQLQPSMWVQAMMSKPLLLLSIRFQHLVSRLDPNLLRVSFVFPADPNHPRYQNPRRRT